MEENFIVCNENDISSFSNFHEFKQSHIHINNKINFENKTYKNFFYFF